MLTAQVVPQVFEDKVYVANRGSGSVTVWDTVTKLTQTIPGFLNPTRLVLNPDGKRLYVIDDFSLYIINTETKSFTVIKKIDFPKSKPFFESSGRPSDLAITPDGKFVYVNVTTLRNRSQGGIIDVAVLNTETNIIEKFTAIDTDIDTLKSKGIVVTQKDLNEEFYDVYVAYENINNSFKRSLITLIETKTNSQTTFTTRNVIGDSLAATVDGLKILGGTTDFERHISNKLAIIEKNGSGLIEEPIKFYAQYFAPSHVSQKTFATALGNKFFMINTSEPRVSVKEFSFRGQSAYGIALNHDENKLYIVDLSGNKVFIYDVVGDIVVLDQTTPSFNVENQPIGIVIGPSSSSPKVVVLPPNHLKVKVIENRFLTQTDLVVRLTWKPSPDPTVIIYNVFRNDELIGTVLADSKLEFDDHNRQEGKTYTYKIEALITDDQVSKPISITIKT